MAPSQPYGSSPGSLPFTATGSSSFTSNSPSSSLPHLLVLGKPGVFQDWESLNLSSSLLQIVHQFQNWGPYFTTPQHSVLMVDSLRNSKLCQFPI